MKINQIEIKGFRNFKHLVVKLNSQNLLIGQNDIGKTNFIYALRLLMDRTISDSEIDLMDSDFYSYEDTNEVFIDVSFKEVSEPAVMSRLSQYVSDESEMVLRLHSIRTSSTIDTNLYIGHDFNRLIPIDTRIYIRAFNIVYVGGSRDLNNLVRSQKKSLIDKEKEDREDLEITNDENIIKDVINKHREANRVISGLSYMTKATTSINQEMKKLLSDTEKIQYRFGVLSRDERDLTKRVDLISNYEGNDMEIGGYGRVNQIYFSLWKDKYVEDEDKRTQVRFYFIEEPEAHLHPHSQRSLANYLCAEIDEQLLISTHSPHILSEFTPENIIRLHNIKDTKASQNGVSDIIGEKLRALSYRLNVVPSESFFSKAILLVEGKSEELFYKALAKHNGIDLDRNNISILSVEGVGFDVYFQALETLHIPVVIRTDLDINLKGNGKYRVAGIQRGISIYRKFYNADDAFENLLEQESIIKDSSFEYIEKKEYFELINKYKEILIKYNIFVAKVDLENDIVESPINPIIKTYFKEPDDEKVVKKLQKRKASNMFEFLSTLTDELTALRETDLFSPLGACVNLVNSNEESEQDEDTD